MGASTTTVVTPTVTLPPMRDMGPAPVVDMARDDALPAQDSSPDSDDSAPDVDLGPVVDMAEDMEVVADMAPPVGWVRCPANQLALPAVGPQQDAIALEMRAITAGGSSKYMVATASRTAFALYAYEFGVPAAEMLVRKGGYVYDEPAADLELEEIYDLALAGHHNPNITSLVYSARFSRNNGSETTYMLVRDRLEPSTFESKGRDILYEAVSPAALVNLKAHYADGQFYVAWREVAPAQAPGVESDLVAHQWSSASPVAPGQPLAPHPVSDCARSPRDAPIASHVTTSSTTAKQELHLAWLDTPSDRLCGMTHDVVDLSQAGALVPFEDHATFAIEGLRDTRSIALAGEHLDPKVLFAMSPPRMGAEPSEIRALSLRDLDSRTERLAGMQVAARDPRVAITAMPQAPLLLVWRQGDELYSDTFARTPVAPPVGPGTRLLRLASSQRVYRVAALPSGALIVTFVPQTLGAMHTYRLDDRGRPLCPAP